MKKYTVEFFGRFIGSIGIIYHQVVIVECESPDQILLKLYDTHEHIDHKTVKYTEHSK